MDVKDSNRTQVRRRATEKAHNIGGVIRNSEYRYYSPRKWSVHWSPIRNCDSCCKIVSEGFQILITKDFSTRALTSWLRVVGASRRSVVWCPPLGGARSARRCGSPPGTAPPPTAAPSPGEQSPSPVPTYHASKNTK